MEKKIRMVKKQAYSMPMGIMAVPVIIIALMILVFGTTAFVYFVRFMKADFLSTGIPLWIVVGLIVGFMLLKSKQKSKR